MQRTLPCAPFLVLTRIMCPIALYPLPFHVMILIQHTRLTLTRTTLMRSTMHSHARPVDLKLWNDAYIRVLDRADRPRPRSSRARTRTAEISFPSAAHARLRAAAGRARAACCSARVEAPRAGAGSPTWVGRRRGQPRGRRDGRTEKRVCPRWLRCDMTALCEICHVQRTVYPESCVTPAHVNAPF